ncbi:MAG: hypothetical protein JRH16_18955 [Deltaproteobacteria bacterium]|nr:hypothetical protein [Deltaproteobacteria bacterium]MBW2362202.1 hypothetical protein [Deltaproteobacteria bacterium]
MQRRRDAGSGIWAVLVVLLVLAGAGAWNYQRNLVVEEAVYRPFRTHTDADLAQLAEAFESQKDRVSEHYDSAAAQRATAREGGHFDQRVREFERVQGIGDAKKELRAELAKSTTTLKLLTEEERLRAGERDTVKLFFKRLLTI